MPYHVGPRPPRELYARVNEIPTPDVAEWLGLTRAKERGKYACPVHGGSDSLHAYPKVGGGFYCWGACGRAFSNIDLAAAVWGIEPHEAVRALADRAGIYVPGAASDPGLAYRLRRANPPAPAAKPARPPEPSPLDALRAEGIMPQEPPAVYCAALEALTLDVGAEYLQGRGFDADAAAAYGFRAIDGAAGWRALTATLAETFLPEELAAAGLRGYPRDWPATTRALVIPFQTASGPVALRLRRLDDENAHRYHTLGGTVLPLPFNAVALDGLAGDELHLVEGEMNAYALRLYGLRVIGLAGVDGWRDEWAVLVQTAGRLVAWYDDDPPKTLPNGTTKPGAGDQGRAKLAASLTSALGRRWVAERARTCTIPRDGDRVRDLNDLHLDGALHDLVAAAPWR